MILFQLGGSGYPRDDAHQDSLLILGSLIYGFQSKDNLYQKLFGKVMTGESSNGYKGGPKIMEDPVYSSEAVFE